MWEGCWLGVAVLSCGVCGGVSCGSWQADSHCSCSVWARVDSEGTARIHQTSDSGRAAAELQHCQHGASAGNWLSYLQRKLLQQDPVFVPHLQVELWSECQRLVFRAAGQVRQAGFRTPVLSMLHRRLWV